MTDPACKVCSPGPCVHGEQSPTPEEVRIAEIEARLAAVTKERDALAADLATALSAMRSGWAAARQLERQVLRAYRNSKRLTGVEPRPKEEPS